MCKDLFPRIPQFHLQKAQKIRRRKERSINPNHPQFLLMWEASNVRYQNQGVLSSDVTHDKYFPGIILIGLGFWPVWSVVLTSASVASIVNNVLLCVFCLARLLL